MSKRSKGPCQGWLVGVGGIGAFQAREPCLQTQTVQPPTPSTPNTTCLLPLVRRYDPPLPRSWPKGFPARKPKPRPILFSISPVSLSKFRPSWDTAFSYPKFMFIEGQYQVNPDLSFPSADPYYHQSQRSRANPSDKEGLFKQFANGSRE